MPRPSKPIKIGAVTKAAMSQPRLRCRMKRGLALFGANLLPRHWVIHAMPDVPANEAAAAESPTSIMPTGLKIPVPPCRECRRLYTGQLSDP